MMKRGDRPASTSVFRHKPPRGFRPVADFWPLAHHGAVIRSFSRVSALAALALGSVSISHGVALATPGEERWIAGSRTATSITGDILLSPSRLRAASVTIPLRVAGDLDRFGDYDGTVSARILEVTRLTNPKMLRGNRFGCGGQPIRWIAVWRFDRGRQLAMATFDGRQMPTSVRHGLCATYYYLRPDYSRTLSARHGG